MGSAGAPLREGRYTRPLPAALPQRRSFLVGLFAFVAACDVHPKQPRPVNGSLVELAATGPVLVVDAAGCAVGIPRLASGVQRGVCLAHSYQDGGSKGYGTRASAASVAELSALGVDWLSLTPFGFMGGLDSESIRIIDDDFAAGETDARLVTQIAQAREAEMRVLLKPHIWIHRGAYRGDIAMGNTAAWQRWFASYGAFMLHYARLAQTQGVEILAIGVELDRVVLEHETAFRQVIQAVREVFSGKLVYCANWDKAVDLGIWDVVDYIGIQFYPPLAYRNDESDGAIRERLAEYHRVMSELSRRSHRPILLTEVGYRAASQALRRPHAWPERDELPSSTNEAAQTRAYRLFFESLEGQQAIRGVYLWKWFTDVATNEEGPAGFSPRGRPAAAIGRAAFDPHCGR